MPGISTSSQSGSEVPRASNSLSKIRIAACGLLLTDAEPGREHPAGEAAAGGAGSSSSSHRQFTVRTVCQSVISQRKPALLASSESLAELLEVPDLREPVTGLTSFT